MPEGVEGGEEACGFEVTAGKCERGVEAGGGVEVRGFDDVYVAAGEQVLRDRLVHLAIALEQVGIVEKNGEDFRSNADEEVAVVGRGGLRF